VIHFILSCLRGYNILCLTTYSSNNNDSISFQNVTEDNNNDDDDDPLLDSVNEAELPDLVP
jgi:hypothetical protein